MKTELKNAIGNSGKTIAGLAYEYNISAPTIHKALNGETEFQPRIKAAFSKIIKDNPNPGQM